MRRLLGASGVPVVVVSAPAGYGKTTLIQDWARRDPRPFHWIAAGRGALTQGRCRARLAELAEGAEQLGRHWVVVADGLEEGLDPVAAEALATLAEAAAPGRTLVVAARGPAPLALGRLRAQQDVLELGARDLAMTHGEAAELLDRHGVRLGRSELDELMRVAEGWPAILSLVAQALPPGRGPRPAAADVAARDPFVVDYVRDELLAPLPAEIVAALTRCSVLEKLEPGPCDAVHGERRAAAWLAALERSPLPVARTDRTSLRLRVHPVVRGVLEAELQRTGARSAGGLHLRASAWFAEHGDLDAAVRHAVAGGDLEVAGALLWRTAQGSAWDGGRGVVDRWLQDVPLREVDRHEGFALAASLRDLSRLRIAGAERRLAAARCCEAAHPEAAGGLLRAGRLALEAATARRGVVAMRERAAVARGAADEREPVRAFAGLLDGAGGVLAGDLTVAVATLEEAGRAAAAAAPGVAALCQAELALVALCDGDFEHGATLAERARARADAIGVEDHAVLALAVAVSAFARAYRGRFAEARLDAELAEAVADERDELPPWYGAQLALALARARLRLSEVVAARALLAEARRAAARLPDAPALSAWIAEAAAAADGAAGQGFAPAEPLTAAELRVLRFLPSHLSFRAIGESLHVSANTIKSQAHAVYRKLGASSRSAAVDRARALGLLEAPAAGVPAPGGAGAAAMHV